MPDVPQKGRHPITVVLPPKRPHHTLPIKPVTEEADKEWDICSLGPQGLSYIWALQNS